jgi:hypothetical protein
MSLPGELWFQRKQAQLLLNALPPRSYPSVVFFIPTVGRVMIVSFEHRCDRLARHICTEHRDSETTIVMHGTNHNYTSIVFGTCSGFWQIMLIFRFIGFTDLHIYSTIYLKNDVTCHKKSTPAVRFATKPCFTLLTLIMKKTSTRPRRSLAPLEDGGVLATLSKNTQSTSRCRLSSAASPPVKTLIVSKKTCDDGECDESVDEERVSILDSPLSKRLSKDELMSSMEADSSDRDDDSQETSEEEDSDDEESESSRTTDTDRIVQKRSGLAASPGEASSSEGRIDGDNESADLVNVDDDDDDDTLSTDHEEESEYDPDADSAAEDEDDDVDLEELDVVDDLHDDADPDAQSMSSSKSNKTLVAADDYDEPVLGESNTSSYRASNECVMEIEEEMDQEERAFHGDDSFGERSTTTTKSSKGLLTTAHSLHVEDVNDDVSASSSDEEELIAEVVENEDDDSTQLALCCESTSEDSQLVGETALSQASRGQPSKQLEIHQNSVECIDAKISATELCEVSNVVDHSIEVPELVKTREVPRTVVINRTSDEPRSRLSPSSPDNGERVSSDAIVLLASKEINETQSDGRSACFPKARRFRREGSVKEGQWKLGYKLGSGAFGVVHIGMNTFTGKLMAVKSIKLERAVMKDIRREVDLLRSLDHINIVRYLGAEMDVKYLHIFQEWVPGGSLTSMISKFGAFPINVVRNYLSQILEGLAYLHDQNIMHRDLKGSNVLVSDDGVVKLADFGASKRLESLQSDLMLSMTMRGSKL